MPLVYRTIAADAATIDVKARDFAHGPWYEERGHCHVGDGQLLMTAEIPKGWIDYIASRWSREADQTRDANAMELFPGTEITVIGFEDHEGRKVNGPAYADHSGGEA